MYGRMKRIGLIDNYIWKFYDTLHTQSREDVTEDVLETLSLWEKKQSDLPFESGNDR